MPFKKIAPTFKVKAIKHYWIHNNVSLTARKFNISRNAVYNWSTLAEQTLKETFKYTTPGKRTKTPKEQISILKEQIKELLKEYHKLSQNVKDQVRAKEPVLCTQCGSDMLVKNGKVLTKKDGFRQRFLCRSCSFSIYVDIKKISEDSFSSPSNRFILKGRRSDPFSKC